LTMGRRGENTPLPGRRWRPTTPFRALPRACVRISLQNLDSQS
jgi:hypothetical protein